MRINIHLELPSLVYEVASSLNQSVNEFGDGEIDFKRLHTPHLTLTMGEIKPEVTLEQVSGRARALSNEFDSFRLLAFQPYFAPPLGNYLFLRVAPLDHVIQIKRQTFDAFSDLLLVPAAGQPDSSPHITIGYFQQGQDTIEAFLSSKQIFSEGNVTSLGISEMGRRGTCSRLLASFAFRNI
jgi:hypothetical protein